MAGKDGKGNGNSGNPPPPPSKKPHLSPPGEGSSGGADPSSRSPSPTGSTDSFQVVDNVQALPDPGEFASLELLHPIIQCLGHDLGNTKRLTHSSLRVVNHSAKLYKEIHELIKKVDGADSPDWESYDKYSNAIEPLENLLFEFAVDADSEKYKLSSKKVLEDLKAADPSSIYKPTDCIAVVSVWEADRALVKKVLDALKTQTELKTVSELVEAEAIECLRHDDRSVLDALSEKISKENLTGLRNSAVAAVATIKKMAGEINTDFKAKEDIDDASSEKCVSSMMLVHEAMEAYKTTSTATQGANKEWNAHLKKHTVWDAAKTLLSTVHEHIKDKTKVDFSALKTKYDEFVKTLYSGKFEVPSSLLDLIKKAAKVKRPFYLQSLVLVAICKELADDFSKDTEKSASKFIPLDETLTAGVAALTQAAQAIENLSSLDASSHKQKSDELFGSVNTKLTECLKVYNKQTNDAQYKNNLKDALDRDKVALDKIQKRLRGETPFAHTNNSAGGDNKKQ